MEITGTLSWQNGDSDQAFVTPDGAAEAILLVVRNDDPGTPDRKAFDAAQCPDPPTTRVSFTGANDEYGGQIAYEVISDISFLPSGGGS
jgi:hypothetical protein